MTVENEGDEELDAIWNPAGSKASPLAKKPLALVVDNAEEAYSAFTTKDKLRGFVVECTTSHQAFYYPHLLNVTLNHPDNTILSLMTTTAVIQVYGRNLRPILSAFRLQTCDSITEFSPKVFPPPSDKSAPFIERIEVIMSRPQEKKERGAKAEEA